MTKRCAKGEHWSKDDKKCSYLKNTHNKIKHFSDWDGTLRTYKAETFIANFNPHSGKDMAKILKAQKSPKCKTVYDECYPILNTNKKLKKFYRENYALEKDVKAWEDEDKQRKEWQNYFINHMDLTDIVADMWKLSPSLRSKYRKRPDGYEGWHTLLHEVRNELEGGYI